MVTSTTVTKNVNTAVVSDLSGMLHIKATTVEKFLMYAGGVIGLVNPNGIFPKDIREVLVAGAGVVIAAMNHKPLT